VVLCSLVFVGIIEDSVHLVLSYDLPNELIIELYLDSQDVLEEYIPVLVYLVVPIEVVLLLHADYPLACEDEGVLVESVGDVDGLSPIHIQVDVVQDLESVGFLD
jgi:hypothetical protein